VPKDQHDIYYLTAERLEDARHSPQIEKAVKSGCDVLFFVDPVDEWLVDDLREYEGKKLVDIAKGDVQFGSEKEQKAEKEANEKAAEDLKPLIDAVKDQLKDSVADVRLSTRLADSPCCLVAGEHALSASMERMLRAMGQDVPHEKRLLEINATHPLVAKMKGLSGDELKDAVELLYDQALIAEGSAVPDPARFTKLLTQLMLK
jgi:molecular chaperone HtpG